MLVSQKSKKFKRLKDTTMHNKKKNNNFSNDFYTINCFFTY